MPTLVGSRLDKYEIQAEVGHGGMAVVYRGRDTVLEREVAVKVLHPHLADREESRLRLRREAITVAKLRHENILEIFDYSGEEATESFLVTEFIHGVTLRQWLDERWRPHPILAALIVHRLCLALAHAHGFDVVHRDIKPENVMIRRDGCLKLMDFGIAQIIDHQKLTMTGQLLGSPAYMAPELISGRPIDARTDLFSVGIMLYQLATGMLPFSGRNPHEVLSKIADATYPPPSSISSLVDDCLEAIIDRALARDPDERFQSAEALASELAGYLAEAGVATTGDEVRAYFQGPKEYVAKLNEQVCSALMEHAGEALRAGQNARAIRLLGRVLELAPDNSEAVALLHRLRRRERRIRWIALVGAGLAGFGLVTAGFLLAANLPDDPKTIQNDESGPTIEASKPPRSLIVPTIPEATPAKPTPDQNTDTPTPKKPPIVGRRPLKKPPKIPVGPKKATCKLIISGGISPANLEPYTLKYAGKKEKLSSLEQQISFNRDKITVNLTGPLYYGQKIVSRTECVAGAQVTLQAKPRPAVLHFLGTPPNTTAECLSGSPCPDSRPHLIGNGVSFPLISMDSREAYLKFRFKAAGYKPLVRRLRIGPGPNDIKLNLNPRGD